MIQKLKLPHPLILIILVGSLLYARSLSFDYTNFDDNTLILENQAYISDLSNLTDAFSKTVFITGSDVFYRPMETIWFILNAQIGGADLLVYHFSSLLLHFLAVYLIFILLMRFNVSRNASLFLSLLFLVHPLHAQAVSWVPGVVDVLVTVFSVSSFISFMNFIRSRKRRDFVLHALFFALALYTKETAIGIGVICLLYLLFIEKEKWFSYNQKVLVAAWLAVFGAWFIMRYGALEGQPGGRIGDVGAMIVSVFRNIPALVQYAGKIFFPFNQSVMPVMNDTTYLFGIASLTIGIVLVVLSKEKKKEWIGFGLVWFVVFLLPTFIVTSEFRVHQFYEHRMYLPLTGILIFLSQTDWVKKFNMDKNVYRIASVAVLIFFFVLTFRHNMVFSDTKSFLDNAVSTSPGSSLAFRNLGIFSQDKNLLEDAEKAYKHSLELNPREKDLHNNLGVIYDTWGKRDLAENEYLKETQMNPSNSQAWHNLGVRYAEINENEKAEKYLLKATSIHPTRSTYEQLALLYKKTGKQQDLEKIISVLKNSDKQSEGTAATPTGTIPSDTPDDPISLGKQLMQKGKMGEAEQVFIKVLVADSMNKEALFNLGLIYYSGKRLPVAEALWRKAIQSDSTYTSAYNNLAICLSLQGKNPEAELVMKKLVSINPDYVDGYFNLANFYARNGNEKEARTYIEILRKRGITREYYEKRGVKLSGELMRLFD